MRFLGGKGLSVRRIFLFVSALWVAFFLAGTALAREDTASRFARFLKEEKHEEAYGLLSRDLKQQLSLENFRKEQEAALRRYQREFGTSKIARAEELTLVEEQVPLSLRDQLALKDVNLGKLLFWRQWTSKRKRKIFQFVFENEERVVFGVDTLSTPRGTVVANYEYLPSLQKVLVSGHPGLTVKKTRVVD